jgi:hypothetical protein
MSYPDQINNSYFLPEIMLILEVLAVLFIIQNLILNIKDERTFIAASSFDARRDKEELVNVLM